MAAEGVIDIELNTSISKGSIQEIKSQLRDLTSEFSSGMRRALNTAINKKSLTGLDYTERTQDYLDNLWGSAGSYSQKFKDLNKSISDKLSNPKLTDQYRDQLIRLGDDLKRAVSTVAAVVSEATSYTKLLTPMANTEQIFKDISLGNVDSAEGVGKAGLALERMNKIINKNKRSQFASEEFKTASYTGRNYALTTGNRARRGFRADEAAQYNTDATAGVLDYMIANEGLNDSLALLGLRWGTEGNHGPNLDKGIYRTIQGFNAAVSEIGYVASKLNDPNVVGPERTTFNNYYKMLQKQFRDGVKVVFADKKYREQAVKAFDELAHLTKPSGNDNMRALGATTVLGALGKTVLDMYRAKWQADISRSAMGTREAQYGEVRSVGQNIGGVLGALIGGAAGTLLGGNTLVGATIGGAVGASAGGIPGEYLQKRLEANKVSIGYILGQHRNETIYGTGFSTALAKAIQDQGIASSSDVTNMANSSLTLRARMMLGMVGEQEMLMLSFMPEYFQALMSGAQGAQLINAYARSGRGIGDSSLRALAMQSVEGGSQGMMAFAQSPYYKDIMRAAGWYSYNDVINRQAMAGMMDARSTTVPIYGAEYVGKEIMKSALKEDPFIYTPGYARPNEAAVRKREEWVDMLGDSDFAVREERARILNWANSPMHIYVYVDGDEVKHVSTTKRSLLDGNNVFRAGSN